MANDCLLDLMKSVHEMMIHPIQPSFIYSGTYNSFNDIKNIKGKVGELMIDASTNNIYTYIDDEWILLCNSYGPTSDITQTKETITEITEMKCKNCGAPLIKYNKYSNTVKCEYCDSIFDIKEVKINQVK